MPRQNASAPGRRELIESVEIDDTVDRVYAQWERYETFPLIMESVRRTKRIDDHRVLWDVEVAGHQLVWAALIVDCAPGKSVRWESTWGVRNSGEVRFEALPEGRTRLTVDIRYRPRRLLEHIGARLGIVDRALRRDLDRFRRFVEHVARLGPAPRAAG